MTYISINELEQMVRAGDVVMGISYPPISNQTENEMSDKEISHGEDINK